MKKIQLKINATFQSVLHDNKQSTLSRVFESEHSIPNFMEKKLKSTFNMKNNNDIVALNTNANHRERKRIDETLNMVKSNFKTFLSAELKIDAKDFLLSTTIEVTPQTIKFKIQYIL